MSMGIDSVLLFSASLFVAAIVPGPGVVALVACALAKGRANALGFLGGILLGDAVWLLMAATGLAALAQAMGDSFLIIKFGGAAWLFYMGSRMIMAAAKNDTNLVVAGDTEEVRTRKRTSFLAGFAVTIGNPKAIIFYLGILPGVLDVAQLVPVDLVVLTIADCLVLIVALVPWIIATDRARALFKSQQARTRLARFSGGVLCLAALLIILM